MTTEHPIKSIRRAGAPLVAYETSDAAQTILACVKAISGETTAPIIQWDCVCAQKGLNVQAGDLFKAFGEKPVRDPVQFLDKLNTHAKTVLSREGDVQRTLVTDALVFIHNGHRLMQDLSVVQALWNLRDTLKAVGATVIILCPTITLPPELVQPNPRRYRVANRHSRR